MNFTYTFNLINKTFSFCRESCERVSSQARCVWTRLTCEFMRCFIAHEEKESYASFKYQFGEIVLFIFVDMNSVGNIMTGWEMFEERDTLENILLSQKHLMQNIVINLCSWKGPCTRACRMSSQVKCVVKRIVKFFVKLIAFNRYSRLTLSSWPLRFTYGVTHHWCWTTRVWFRHFNSYEVIF